MIKPFFFIKFFRQAVLFTGCLFAFSCENSQKALDEWKGKKVMVEEAKDINTFFSQGGKMRSRLTAPLMLRYTSDTIYAEFPKTLRMVFFDSVGSIESRMDARYGKYFESLNKAFLRDSVVVGTVRGDTLWTSELWWDQNTQRFFTDKRVRIYRKGDRIYGGKGLEASQDLTSVVIYQIEAPSRFMVADSVMAQ